MYYGITSADSLQRTANQTLAIRHVNFLLCIPGLVYRLCTWTHSYMQPSCRSEWGHLRGPFWKGSPILGGEQNNHRCPPASSRVWPNIYGRYLSKMRWAVRRSARRDYCGGLGHYKYLSHADVAGGSGSRAYGIWGIRRPSQDLISRDNYRPFQLSSALSGSNFRH